MIQNQFTIFYQDISIDTIMKNEMINLFTKTITISSPTYITFVGRKKSLHLYVDVKIQMEAKYNLKTMFQDVLNEKFVKYHIRVQAKRQKSKIGI